jgi:epsin
MILCCGCRLALTGTKKWRQIFKALTVMEYLLTHGPVQFVVEFRVDKEQVEELTRFVFIDENMYVSDSRLIVKL